MITLSFEFNWAATAVAALLGFVLGNFWHNQKTFGKAWVNGHNLSADHAKGFNFAIMFGLTLLQFLIASIGMSVLYASFLPGIGAGQGFLYGMLIALLWVSTSFGVTYIFLRKSLTVWLIDAGYYVVAYGIMGLIIAAWQ